MKRKLLRCMSVVATLLLASSCTSELALEGVPQSGVEGEEVEVTFSISAQSANAAMRDATAKGPGQWQKHIGRGEKIDILIYGVYEYNEELNENGSHYTLLKQYGQDYLKYEYDEETGTAKTTKSTDFPSALGNLADHQGQTIINVRGIFEKDGKVEITLRLMRNKEYHIAFWAQNSETTAFDTRNLEAVKVNYADAKNNDELRDAFCKVESFSVSPSTTATTIVLTRPMAQINVGATGYSNYAKSCNKSKIVLTGVSNTINVVTDEILPPTEDANTATFDWASLDKFIFTDGEEYLRIDIDNNGEIDKDKGYSAPAPFDDDPTTTTEEFKYLSMCYALVPASTDNDPEVSYASSVLDEVKVYLNDSEDQSLFEGESGALSIKTVPVHRNWRTNILLGFDNAPFNANPKIVVSLQPEYDGEYNGEENAGHTWTVIGTTGN